MHEFVTEDIRDYDYDDFLDNVENYLTEERYQNCRIQKAYERSLQAI